MIYPLLVGVWYTLFSVVYWATGGRDPDGHSWIYPMLDWDHPDTAVITVTASAAGTYDMATLMSGIYLISRIGIPSLFSLGSYTTEIQDFQDFRYSFQFVGGLIVS